MNAAFMQAWLFDSLFVTTLLMVAILLLRGPVAKICGPGIAYALWLIPAARLLMPGLEAATVPAGDGGQAVRDAVRETILAAVPPSSPVVSVAGELTAASPVDYAALGVTFWLGGAALFFIIQMIRYASMRDDLLSEVEEIANIDGVRVVASDQVVGPLAFGLARRYIAVPRDFTKAYSPAERELAIAHEMAHHKSGDLFANLAAFTILCLQWFNPVAWISWNAFRFDQEAACDARVLAGKDAKARAIYGQALARTAFDGVPTFVTALNSPKTIIERLRRLSMQDASKTRRSIGRLGIIAAGAIILPLTATMIPAVVAQEAEKAAGESTKPETVKRQVKIIKIRHKDGESADALLHEGEGKEVTKIQRDGKIFIFHTDKKLSEAEVEKMIADAEKSRAEADVARAGAEAARAEAEIARGHAEITRAHTMKTVLAYIPEIDIKEITKNCQEGQPVTTDVSGFDGQNKSRIRLVMCGKGQARIARVEAIKGLSEARDEIGRDKDIPDSVRKDVIAKLEQQIRKLEAQADKADQQGD